MAAAGAVYTSGQRCCAECSLHLHGDRRIAAVGCGRCALHLKCAERLEVCEECQVPIGTPDLALFSQCNVNRCRKKAPVICGACATQMSRRFEKHVAMMSTLPMCSVEGWLVTNGLLRDRDNKKIVSVVLEALLREAEAGYTVKRTSTGVEYFSETVARAAGPVTVPTSYDALVALVPTLPPEAAGALRRFVLEKRRHWEEIPGRRAVLSRGRSVLPSAEAMLKGSTALVQPGRLLAMGPDVAKELLALKQEGKIHAFGRGIFYFQATRGPRSPAAAKSRLKKWKAILRATAPPRSQKK